MKSIREIFRIGYGPSSSHTMGPGRAAYYFKEKNPDAERYRVTLYGSLALTGSGARNGCCHPEDDRSAGRHGNYMGVREIPAPSSERDVVRGFKKRGSRGRWEVYSVGGGALWDELGTFKEEDVYPDTKMTDILDWCKAEGRSFVELRGTCTRDPEIFDYLEEVWKVMVTSIHNGLENEGVLPGNLRLARKACSYHVRAQQSAGTLRHMGMVFAAALAVAEENAAGGKIVTAPTCGSAGVVPSVLFFLKHDQEISDKRIIKGLATAGLIGNIVKTNGSISGAEVGCQGELGTACAMAAGAAAQILGGSPMQIEYAAEMGFEHNLGLTCDPVGGYVQIPCIERNAFISQKARECAIYSLFSDGRHKVSFDDVWRP